MTLDEATQLALIRIHMSIENSAQRDLRMIRAMVVARRRGIGQLYRHAVRRVRAIQQGAVK